MKENVLKELAQNGLGIVKIKSINRGHVWWLNIEKDIEKIAANYNCAEVRSMPRRLNYYLRMATNTAAKDTCCRLFKICYR